MPWRASKHRLARADLQQPEFADGVYDIRRFTGVLDSADTGLPSADLPIGDRSDASVRERSPTFWYQFF